MKGLLDSDMGFLLYRENRGPSPPGTNPGGGKMVQASGATRRGLGQPFRDALTQTQSELLVADARQQTGGLHGDQGRGLFEIGSQNGFAQLRAHPHSLRGCSKEADFPAQETAVPAELEQQRLAAIPTALELDGGQVVAVVEAGGDQEQRFEISVVLESVGLDEMGQIRV